MVAGRAGLRVVGDVHGEAGQLQTLLAGAREARRAVLLLGDLVDRGPDSPAAAALALELIERGEGDFVPGNHDDKLRRHVAGNPVDVSGELGRTLDQFRARADGDALLRAFADAVATRPLWRRLANHVFVHAGFDRRMLDVPPPTLADRRGRELRHIALYGAGPRQGGRVLRAYDWVDGIPAGIVVVIGHDVVDLERIVTRRGAAGGALVHLDTGAGTGGRLSHLDLPPGSGGPPGPPRGATP